MEKVSFKGIYAMLSIMLIGIIASATLSGLAFYSVFKAQNPEEEGTKENGVIIASQYEILSTEHISDAYINGDPSGLNDRDREIYDMASAVLEEIITEGMSDLEKEEAVYIWLCKNVGFDGGILTVVPTSDADSGNPYGVLKYKSAVCAGYATTFRLFMQMMEIPCMVVHNTEQYHSWDLVQIEGEWYHTDVYSDSSTANFTHFNMTDTMVGQSWDRTFYPAATSYTHNISYQNAAHLNSIVELPARIRTALENQESNLSFLFDKSLTEAEAAAANSMVSAVESALWSTEDFQNTYMSWNFVPVDNGYLYTIVVYYNEDYTPAETISDETVEALTQAIKEAFEGFLETNEIIMSIGGEAEYPEDFEGEFGGEFGEEPGEELGNDYTENGTVEDDKEN